MMILVLLGCLLIGGTSGARLKRMVGGYNVEITKVPYQVSVRYIDYHVCGGSLISNRHVLTAAHCVSGLFEEPYDDITILTGTDRLKSGGTVHNVSNITCHKDFIYDGETYWNHDIAVITLAENVAENEKQKAIMLPIEEAPVNATGFVSGFGRTVNGYVSPILKGMNATILPIDKCRTFANIKKIRDNQICGKQPKGYGICKGDSGGPLVYNKSIIGVASWNWPNPCGSGVPDVYINVYRYLDFIKTVIKNQ